LVKFFRVWGRLTAGLLQYRDQRDYKLQLTSLQETGQLLLRLYQVEGTEWIVSFDKTTRMTQRSLCLPHNKG
jgi:hypothetical protein